MDVGLWVRWAAEESEKERNGELLGAPNIHSPEVTKLGSRLVSRTSSTSMVTADHCTLR